MKRCVMVGLVLSVGVLGLNGCGVHKDGSSGEVAGATGGGDPSATGGGDPSATGGGDPSATGGGDPSATGGGDPSATGGGDPSATGGGTTIGGGAAGGSAGGLSNTSDGGSVSLRCHAFARFADPFLDDLAVEAQGVLSVRVNHANSGWLTMLHEVDLNTRIVTSAYEGGYPGAAAGSRATNGRGLSLVLGGMASTNQQCALYSRYHHQSFPMPATANWSVHDVAYNPNRDEFALFWFGSDTPHPVPTNKIMMQTRFQDGGVGFTRRLAARDFMGSPDAVSWAPGRYFVLGTAGVHIVTEDGQHQTSVPFQSTPGSIATNGATRAGATEFDTVGRTLLFAHVDGLSGSVTETPIQTQVGAAAARVVWDPVLREWHVAYTTIPNEYVSLASFSEAGAMVRNVVLDCRVQAKVIDAVLDGRALYIGYSNLAGQSSTAAPSGVLRIDL